MRKFRLIRNADDYDGSRVIGEVLEETFIPWTVDGKPNHNWDRNQNVLDASQSYPRDWEEVFEGVSEGVKTLHKDTDLGHFAGVAMEGLLKMISTIEGANTFFAISDAHNPNLAEIQVEDHLCSFAIKIAQQLIKQLDEQKLK